jgi:transcriptional regulator with XRE-family HTH domain
MYRIKELRKKSGLSQKELADKLFVNQTAVSQWERGVTSPSASILIKLCDLFNVTSDYLLGRTDNPRTANEIADRLGILAKERTPDEERLYEALKNDEKIRKILIGIYALPESAREGFLQFAAASITREREENDDK